MEPYNGETYRENARPQFEDKGARALPRRSRAAVVQRGPDTVLPEEIQDATISICIRISISIYILIIIAANAVSSLSRTQALWTLHLAGDWHPQSETASRPPARPHMMRTMLTSNLAVEQRVLAWQGRYESTTYYKPRPAWHPFIKRWSRSTKIAEQ